MTLEGPWTDDNNMAPICDNDYHWNNEQEMQVRPVYTSNRVEFGDPMFDMIEENLETLKEVCRLHFKTEGAFLTHSTDPYLRPTYATVDNYELNGLPWVCFHYWKRYLYTMDEEFLRERAYPVMKLAVQPVLSELQEWDDGKLHLPWTSSPEYHGIDETLRWLDKKEPDWSIRFGPDATIDLALLKALLRNLCSASEILGCEENQKILTVVTGTPYSTTVEPACHVHEVLTAMSEGGEKGTFTDILSDAGKQMPLNSGAYTITKGWSADHPFVMKQ